MFSLSLPCGFVSTLPLSRSPLRDGWRGKFNTARNRPSSTVMTASGNDESHNKRAMSRRDFLRVSLLSVLGASGAGLVGSDGSVKRAEAINGLRVYPFREPLMNNYYLMRAAQTKSNAAGVTAVNPVDKLSIDKLGLTAQGVRDAQAAADALLKGGISLDMWLWPSVTMSAFETAEVLASQMRIRRDRIVPEYSFLDARGVGAMEGFPVKEVSRVLYEHDRQDPNWRPAPGEDGTPNDSANDVFVRINQLISKLETQYFAQDIVVVAPDSDPLSVWQAAVTGHDINQHPDMWYAPGEVRLVKEQVVDAYGKVVESGSAKTLFKPA